MLKKTLILMEAAGTIKTVPFSDQSDQSLFAAKTIIINTRTDMT